MCDYRIKNFLTAIHAVSCEGCILAGGGFDCGYAVCRLSMGVTIGAKMGKCNYAHCITLNLTQNRNPKEGHNRVRHENEKEIERRNGKTVLYGNEFIFLL